MNKSILTEHMTQASQQIEHDSFAIVDQGVEPHDYTGVPWHMVRRRIHATAESGLFIADHEYP